MEMKKYTELVKALLGTMAMLLVFMPQAQALSWEQASGSNSIIIVRPGPENDKFPGARNEDGHKFKFDRQSLRSTEQEHHVRDDSQVPVVPEPETYAMMLAGLGLLFITMSRQKKSNFK